MARKTKQVTITTEGRDKGRTYLITEMPATQAEKWAMRAMSALLKSGVYVPDSVLDRGLAGIAAVGIKGLMGMQFQDAEPLMDEMFACIQIVEPAITRKLTENDIEEVATRLLLRSEVIELHVGFSIAAYLSKMWVASGTTTDANTLNSEISPAA